LSRSWLHCKKKKKKKKGRSEFIGIVLLSETRKKKKVEREVRDLFFIVKNFEIKEESFIIMIFILVVVLNCSIWF
jgi:hypothetical protein